MLTWAEGDDLTNKANIAQKARDATLNIPSQDGLHRLFSVRNEFSNDWYRFLHIAEPATQHLGHPHQAISMPGVVPISGVLRINGPHVATIQKVVPEAYIADTFEQAVPLSAR